MPRIESPEGIIRDATSDVRLLDQIESRIAFLTEELENLNKKMKQERKRSKLRQMEEQKQQLEYELRWARYQEAYLTKSIFRKEAKDA